MFFLKQYWKLPSSREGTGYFWQEIYLEGNMKTINSLLFKKEKIGTLVTLQNNYGCSCSNNSETFRWWCAFEIEVQGCWQAAGPCLRAALLREENHPGSIKDFPVLLRGVTAMVTDAFYPPGYWTCSSQRVALKTPPVLPRPVPAPPPPPVWMALLLVWYTQHKCQTPFLGLAKVHSV